MERMLAMARLDNPKGSPFLVGEAQREWLRKDLEKVDRETPVIVCSHSPLQKIFKGWNFWTDDAEEVRALLEPFKKVNVVYGHVHQIQYNQIGNISFYAVMATAWPWPHPSTIADSTMCFGGRYQGCGKGLRCGRKRGLPTGRLYGGVRHDDGMCDNFTAAENTRRITDKTVFSEDSAGFNNGILQDDGSATELDIGGNS